MCVCLATPSRLQIAELFGGGNRPDGTARGPPGSSPRKSGGPRLHPTAEQHDGEEQRDELEKAATGTSPPGLAATLALLPVRAALVLPGRRTRDADAVASATATGGGAGAG
ncbi:hypothetical protein Pen02_07890 [Plantactinospora endophytica]|uniref:Uncharacterized protein n=1 Tax=Plantactinospora endophytica TaxID=673535 RepID=A0ABQ4DTR7_9ACTN|nr:hypothetical protein Pen02_07890 [Plantactinospora endophytica]